MNHPPSSLHPRKQPVQPRAMETYAWMLEAAAQILESQGIGAFNTNLVAERAGVSIGSLYQYFPGKDALLIALMRREKARFGEDAAAARDAPDGRSALAHLVAAAVRHQLERPEHLGLLRVALDHADLPPQPDRKVAVDDIAALVRLLVDAAGARDESDAPQLERRVLGAILGYLGVSPDERAA
jgi:AcrR family transcriptional regulator